MKPISSRLIDKINQRKEEGTLRSLSHLEGLIDFYSNDYLSLSKIAIETAHKQYSGTGSRLISGTSMAALQCEENVADFFGFDVSLMFNSGYDANLGLFSCVPQKGDTVLYDNDIHASVRDGIRLSHARAFSFRHNDLEDLERLLKKSLDGDIYVVIESLYSMKGDLAPLQEIVKLCNYYGAFIIVDEAHSAGVLGKEGKGLVYDQGLQNDVLAVVVTFGKAFGAHGAAVLSNLQLKQYLLNYARSFIYTTALPPECYSRISEILERNDLDARRIQLVKNVSLIRTLIPALVEVSDRQSPIQIVKFNDRSQLRKKADQLRNAGFGVKPIYAPTVPKNEECLRISLHTDNEESEIRRLSELLLSDH